jgi:universal stress protein A
MLIKAYTIQNLYQAYTYIYHRVFFGGITMNDYTHILLAVDFTASADQLVIKARDIAQRNNAKLSLLHVVEYLPPIDYVNDTISSYWVINDNEMLEYAKQSLEELSKKHKLANVELTAQFGTPKREISQYVKDHQCDLVVLGSHGRHGINLLLGSTANAVLNAMPCDILTVKIEG